MSLTEFGVRILTESKQGEITAKLVTGLFFAFVFKTSTGKVFSVIALFENDVEITLYRYGGSLNFVARRFL